MQGCEEVRDVALADITTDGMQTRASNRPEAVRDYADGIRAGEKFDAAVVYQDQDGTLRLAAGHHRRAAYETVGWTHMPCIVRRGDRWAAIQHGIEDNRRHRGERLTAADRRHNAELVLREQPGMSDRAIAELCGVSPSTVGKYRQSATVQIGQFIDPDGEGWPGLRRQQPGTWTIARAEGGRPS
jgi:ParB-like chromosome segregation protein Spo0J